MVGPNPSLRILRRPLRGNASFQVSALAISTEKIQIKYVGLLQGPVIFICRPQLCKTDFVAAKRSLSRRKDRQLVGSARIDYSFDRRVPFSDDRIEQKNRRPIRQFE